MFIDSFRISLNHIIVIFLEFINMMDDDFLLNIEILNKLY